MTVIENKLQKFLFPVEERSVYVDDKPGINIKPTKEYKAIVRGDNGNLISIMKDTYQLVPNRDVIMPLMEQLHNLDTKWIIDPSHSFVSDDRMRLQVTFPDLKLNDGRSDIALSLYLFNSYNGAERVRLIWGGIRAICSNGMIWGSVLAKYFRKHTSGLEIKDLKAQVESTYEKIPVIKNRIELLQNTKVTEKVRREVEDKLGKHVVKYIAEQEKQYKKAANLWVLYNLITYYVSHQVDLRMRASYQIQTSRIFKL